MTDITETKRKGRRAKYRCPICGDDMREVWLMTSPPTLEYQCRTCGQTMDRD